MANIDRWRPPTRESYVPPVTTNSASRLADRPSKSPARRLRDVPPAVPTPPSHSHYPPRSSPSRPNSSRRSIPAPSPARSAPGTPMPIVDQWFFTEDEVLSSPSIIDGLSPAEERLRRAKGVNFIYQAGIYLEMPQITLYVAGVFFHRFFMRRSMVEEKGGIHHYVSLNDGFHRIITIGDSAHQHGDDIQFLAKWSKNIAATALFLANKTEENCRKTKDLIIAVAKVAQKNANLIIDEQSKEYWRWRDSILMYEEVMLETLTFDLVVGSPYLQLYKLLEQIGAIHNKLLRHAAWAFCNDACLTTIPLLMDARDIAMSSIFFASNFRREPIDDVNGTPWWQSLNGNEALMTKAIDVMSNFYAENPLRKQDNPYEGSPSFTFENTRKPGEGSSSNATPRTDQDNQSPKPRVNGTDVTSSSKEVDMPSTTATTAVAEAHSLVPGDSDAHLKEAANDPATHPVINGNGVTNGSGLVSPKLPGKREVESQDSDGRESKRQRMSEDGDNDEGEVRE